jgi:hypothetical protein
LDITSSIYNAEEKANYIENEYVQPTFLLAYKRKENGEKILLYLENAKRNHMCGNKRKFVEFIESMIGNVIFGDLSKVLIKVKSTILIRLRNGEH